ncbi:hypothetical protein SFUMM280S_08829 [Streptomyces fumanus]
MSNVPAAKVPVAHCHCWVGSAGSPVRSCRLESPVSHWPLVSGPAPCVGMAADGG